MGENLENKKNSALSSTEIDAIGEVLNISMGSAATAISTMLDRQVLITTPHVEVQKFHDLSYASMEPAIIVKIEYVEGISGSNVMVFRQSDIQVIINLLMGIEGPPSDDFIFDEMTMSAACEVMNQMMGASATALSGLLRKTVNISTPDASILDSANTFQAALALGSEDEIVSIAFELDIADAMKTEFISVMPIPLAKNLVSQLIAENEDEDNPLTPEIPQAVSEAVASAPAAPAAAPVQQSMPDMQAQQPAYPQQPAPGMYPQQPAAAQQYPPQYPPYPQQPPMPEWQGQPYPGGMPPYYGYAPYGYPMPMPQPEAQHAEPVNVQMPKFPSFAGQPGTMMPQTGSNMDLMMNVPLTVSVEIGQTKKKIKEIMDFGQGTVIELEKQAGAPADIVVNGQLIARGDIVVVEDNFGVRITEIVSTKELMESLEKQN